MTDPSAPMPQTSDVVPQFEGAPAPSQNGPSNPAPAPAADVEMADSAPVAAAQRPSHAPDPPTSAPTPIPAAAPAPAVNQIPTTSRNSPYPRPGNGVPTQGTVHGAPTRVYLNEHVTPHLLEAMKYLVTEEPDKPLKYLSEFLARKSAELEGP